MLENLLYVLKFQSMIAASAMENDDLLVTFFYWNAQLHVAADSVSEESRNVNRINKTQ